MTTTTQSDAQQDAPAETCFHCGLPMPHGAHYPVRYEGKERQTCCPGCQAVMKTIIANDLGNYYRNRTQTAGSSSEPIIPDELKTLALFDEPELQRQFVRESVDKGSGLTLKEASLMMEGITCAACIWLNERHIQSLEGVVEFKINYSTHRAQVRWDPEQIAFSEILRSIRELGYQAHPFDTDTRDRAFKRERRQALQRIAVAGLGMMQIMMLAVPLWLGSDDQDNASVLQFIRWVAAFLTTPVVLYAALPFYRSAWRDLRNRRLGMDVPVSLAIISTYLASLYSVAIGSAEHVYFESVAMFVFFLLTGRFIESMAHQSASQAIDRLDRLIPALATQIDEEGTEQQVPVIELAPGNWIRVKPGETIPVDGSVVEGQSTINQALLTGEPEPCLAQIGDSVTGGTVNVDSPLTIEVTRVGAETTLAAIQRLLDRAQTEKPRLAQMAEKGTGNFIAAVLILTALVGLVWYFWIDPSRAFWVAIAMLVATCPCALALATPVAITATTGAFSRLSLLLTRGQAIENLARAKVVCLDKTGTLTLGHPELIQVEIFEPRLEQKEFLRLVAALEVHSEHPAAKALTRACGVAPATARAVQNHPGFGIEGEVEGRKLKVGNAEFVSVSSEASAPEQTELTIQRTPVYVSSDGALIGVCWLADQPRPGAQETIARLKKLGLEPVLLSGDQAEATSAFAREIGIDTALGGLTPESKLEYVRERQSKGDLVLMAGEGINDAPVLAGADVSLAMGSGTRIAQTQADLILMSDRLATLPESVVQARRTLGIIRQNIIWAIGYNALALPVAATGLLTPWLAALGMSLSSLLVVGNALRLRGKMR